ncbi:MAG TPA: cation:dicarboxylase symporter family transporter [Terracidiphilus sp.]|jgi:proton glutamate symport protein|nr:cation:dicarboxylase symporter family transporter [Terracidiphilus sp.]
MTPTDKFAKRNKRSPISLAFSLMAAVLWLAGVALGFAGLHTPGVLLRVAGLILCAGASMQGSSLLFWTLFAMPAGVELGLDAPHVAMQVRVLGDLFLRLIRMIVAPLLFATITTGIAGHGQLRSIGRVALKALVYFEVVTTLGLILGAAAMILSGAGWGVVLPATSIAPTLTQPVQGWQQILLNIFPENIAQAVAQNQVLQIAVFSVFFATALAMLPQPKRSPLLGILQLLADVMFQLTRIIMYLAPVAAAAALASTVSAAGLSTLLPLARLGVTYYAALIVFIVVVQIPTLLIFRIPLRPFIAAVAEPASIGFATTTSEAALPLAMERMEELGVPRWIVSFVIPAGYSFNMTGSSVYLSMAAVFCAQAAGIHQSLGQLTAMLAILMLASKGVAGIPRAVLVVLLATASAVQLPTAPILLILGIDTLMDMGRTMMNVVGNCIASAVIAKTEGELAVK